MSINLSPDMSLPSSRFFFKSLVGVYIRPRRAFREIVRVQDFWTPFVTVVFVKLLVVWAAIAKIGVARLTELRLTWGASGVYFAQDHPGNYLTFLNAYLDMHFRAVLVPAIIILSLGVGGFAAAEMRFGVRLPFKNCITIASYAYLVNVLGGILALGVLFFGDPERYKPQLPTPTNFGFFMSPFENPYWIIRSAGGIDILTLWFLVLFGIGYSVATGGKIKARWVSLVLIGLLLSNSLISAMSGYLIMTSR